MVAHTGVIIQSSYPWLERVAAIFFRNSKSMFVWAADLEESDLNSFSFKDSIWGQEDNAIILEAERKKNAWKQLFNEISLTENINKEKLERLACQHFFLDLGRQLNQFRQYVKILKASGERQSVGLVTDLPKELICDLLSEMDGTLYRLNWASNLIYYVSSLIGALKLMARHLAVILSLFKLISLPKQSQGTKRPYITWLNATATELDEVGINKFSLLEFLIEAKGEKSSFEIMVQGAKSPSKLPDGIYYTRSRLALRYRPNLKLVISAFFQQLRLVYLDIISFLNWRRRLLLADLLLDLPGSRLWFISDSPVAVIYGNNVIGAEPPVSVMGHQYGIKTMMLFYSSNVAYYSELKPDRRVGVSQLEPEIRFIAADRIGMWSQEMQDEFLRSGYSKEKLPVVGVVHYGRQAHFEQKSIFSLDGKKFRGANKVIRIGVFDVSPQLPIRRFFNGLGQSLYHPDYCRSFFSDLIFCATKAWGDDFILIRKCKRILNKNVHLSDIDLNNLLPNSQLIMHEPDSNLWVVLSELDLVICMPFTSVAYMADHYGIPAAYYDPSCEVTRSPLAGRAPLLSGVTSLQNWLRDPQPFQQYDPSVIVAREAISAATGSVWHSPSLVK